MYYADVDGYTASPYGWRNTIMNTERNDLSTYLACDDVIDWRKEAVMAQANRLADADLIQTARRCFLFVRDEIFHSVDINADTVTCSASEVLREGHGYCYAKSHLLAALLRANGIHSGFDYQRLEDGEGGFMLHGFNTILLPGSGWYRVDARGNKEGVDAQFTPPQERLAWSHDAAGEVHYRVNLAEPHPQVVAALQRPLTVQQLWRVLPSAI